MTFKVTYELRYPDCDNDIRVAYVIADSFQDAERKVEKKYERDSEGAYVQLIEMLGSDIIT